MNLPNFNHLGIFGTSGVGKSTVAELICEIQNINKGWKIIDLQNNKYLEVCSFMGPTRNQRFISNMKRYSIKPRGFPTEVFHPIVNGLPPKLPEIVHMYTLPMDFFAYEEVLRVLTNDSFGDASYVSLTQEVEKMKKTDSFPAISSRILESIDSKILKTSGLDKVPMFFYFDSQMSAGAVNRPLLKVKNVGIFSSASHEHCLTDKRILDMIKDTKTITGFSTRWIDQRHKKIKLAVNLYLLMKIRDMAKKSGKKVAVYIREAREIFPNPRYSDKAMKVLAEVSEDMIKDCRKAGVHLILDTQTPWDLPDGVLDQISMRFIFRHDKKDSDIMDMYSGSSSLDRERIKHIKKLKDYRFYISSPNIPISTNTFGGIMLDYKISGHLEESVDEVKYIRKEFPQMKLYNTNDYVESLRADWMQTHDKYSGKFNRRYQQDQEKTIAKSMGIAWSDFKFLKYVYMSRQENSERVAYTYKDILTNTSMAKGTLTDCLDRMTNKGLIKRSEKGEAVILDSALDLIKNNIKVFENQEQ